ncbi:MAG: hypothetical protein FJ190_08095 [Gammaproteobacteria bacterium]|nr:hypothetical protein [Gammaproteobacteria bacterium]
MVKYYLLLIASLLLALSACANSPDTKQKIFGVRPYLPVAVQVIGDNSGSLPEYPVNDDGNSYRAYVQANRDERYRVKVSNNSDQRVGLVIAVDGRNIISGQKSYLQNTERMYILNPHTSGEYEGWRSSQNQVNRFYFTESADSYAAAWGDTSAMGVIAVAVYAEQPRPPVAPMTDMLNKGSAAAAPEAKGRARMESEAGTGYGENRYSPTAIVNFEPQPTTMEKVFLKYEWRETLCKKRILEACQEGQSPHNRFWPDDNSGYAPPPPRRRY